MGLRDWLSRGASTDQPQLPAALLESQRHPVKMTGTTTVGADAVQALFLAHRKYDGGVLDCPAHLVAEPGNAVDANAVAIYAEGARVGYLPGHLASQLHLAPGDVLECQVQLWGRQEGERLRVVGWVAYGREPVAWPHSHEDPPPVTITEQRAAAAAATTAMVDEALGGTDPDRAAQFRRGMVGRYHYLETVEPIKQLKREGHLEEALELCYGAIEAAEHDRGGCEPAPWYTEQAAIIHRKRGERELEIAVLQRWLAACSPARRTSSSIQQRLDKILSTGDTP